MSEALRVLVVDDHEEFRHSLETLLGAMDDVEVVGRAGDGRRAVALALDLQPDVVVMDLHMPDLNGVEATRRIVATSPHIAVLVLTMFDDDDSVFAAMRAGARGYLLKGADHTEILRAIEGLSRGEAIFGPSVAQRIIEFFTAPRHARIEPVFPELTEREHEVLDLIAAGHNNTEIGEQLVLSPKTVRNHVSNIFTKLQVADRAQAIVRARQAGLGR
jgi:DNA-binding NarL/FixJ family response regulator